ncbi:galectin-4-like [Amblyomma americanum]
MDYPMESIVLGSVINLTGHILSTPKRFYINLVTGTGDIALHVNIRFDTGMVVINSFRNDSWETEERFKSLPVQQGHNFEAKILVYDMGYKVAFNQHHFADFKHRLLYSTVEKLKADGCVTLYRVEQERPLGSLLPVMESCCKMPPANGPTIVYDPTMPLLHMLPGGILIPGLMVYLSGRPLCEGKSFFVSFQCGGPGSEIAFHFSPRFHQKVVVCNSNLHSEWGTEERQYRPFPFVPGVHFDLVIRVLDSAFDVVVNGQHYLTFQHRLRPLQRVSHLMVDEDVLLASCKFYYYC